MKKQLDYLFQLYNDAAFIEKDPVSIPHRFSDKGNIEVAGFFAATLAWGQRGTLLRNLGNLMKMMDDAPFSFVRDHTEQDLQPIKKFVHRTFNGEDCIFFIRALQNLLQEEDSLEPFFARGLNAADHPVAAALDHFRKKVFEFPHLARTEKHLASPASGSACKRMNMFLRWMVRKDKQGVDFGIWSFITPADLVCPLDVHSGRVARGLGLLKRKQNDWRAALELTENLKSLDPKDPVKYDFALFGAGVNKQPIT